MTPRAALATTLGIFVALWAGFVWSRGRQFHGLFWFSSKIAQLARKRTAVIAGAGLLVVLLRISLLAWWPIPAPQNLDEFSYLLMGDTFASGRLTNPPHPIWQHFETLFELQQPTYASVYPVMQGLFLAAGATAAGHPWWGVVLSAGLMCAAIAWAAQGWLPPVWALLGALWASLQLALSTYWINSYWGGAPAAIGGALVVGAVPRLMRDWNSGNIVWMAMGLGILANSRPYEGFLLGTCSLVYVGTTLVRQRGLAALGRFLLLLLIMLIPIAAGMGFYFNRVTGNPFKLPAEAYIEQYAASPLFIWQRAPREPSYRHMVLRDAHRSFMIDRLHYQTVAGAVMYSVWKLGLLGRFYLGPLLFVPLIMLPCLWRLRIRPLLIAAAVVMIGILVVVPVQPHYGAPLAAVFTIVTMEALRKLWLSRRYGNAIGLFLVPAALISVLLVLQPPFGRRPKPPLAMRPELINWLKRSWTQNVVFVRYRSQHEFGNEWVYNGAEIDGSSVVWVRDMGVATNQEVVDYYRGRQFWLLQPDLSPIQLVPYDAATIVHDQALW
jgi:hypothetical protein